MYLIKYLTYFEDIGVISKLIIQIGEDKEGKWLESFPVVDGGDMAHSTFNLSLARKTIQFLRGVRSFRARMFSENASYSSSLLPIINKEWSR